MKRGLRGTYVAVEPFHLERYVAEQVFRLNNRATRDNPLNDADRFAIAVSQIVGKRLTYAELTGKEAGSTTLGRAGGSERLATPHRLASALQSSRLALTGLTLAQPLALADLFAASSSCGVGAGSTDLRRPTLSVPGVAQ